MTSVDIIVRTKNRPGFFRRALDDIRGQEFGDWHITVVNDGGAREPVESALDERPDLAGRVSVLHLPESVGRGGALHAGIGAGTAPLLTWHDDDDTWHPQFLTRTVEHLRASHDIGVAVRTEIVWERVVGERTVETGREAFHPHMAEPTYFDLLRFNHVVPIGLLYRRSAHDHLGAVDPRLRSVGDWEFNLRLWQASAVGFLDGEPLACWHQRRAATGPTANSVHAEPASHYRFDRYVRDEALRATGEGGALLHLAKYVDERAGELRACLDRLDRWVRSTAAATHQ